MSFDVLGLDEDAFSRTCDDRYTFVSEPFRRAHAQVKKLAEADQSPIVLTGVPGIGKTTFLRYLALSLNDGGWSSVIWRAGEALRDVHRDPNGTDLVPPAAQGDGETRGKSFETGGRIAVLIDDAHDLSDQAVEDICGSASTRTSDVGPRTTVVLAGTSALAERLSGHRPESPGWAHVRLLPLRHEDVGGYVRHRLKIAGNHAQDLFSAAAVDLIAAYSRGVPGQINRLSVASLLLAELEGRRLVDVDLIHEAAADVGLVDTATFSELLPSTARHSKAGGLVGRTVGRQERAYAVPASGRPSVAGGGQDPTGGRGGPSEGRIARHPTATSPRQSKALLVVAVALMVCMVPATDQLDELADPSAGLVTTAIGEDVLIPSSTATHAPDLEGAAAVGTGLDAGSTPLPAGATISAGAVDPRPVPEGVSNAQDVDNAVSGSELDPAVGSIERGDALLALGDYAAARLFYEFAVRRGSPQGAVKLAQTYDPIFLEGARVQGLRADPRQAALYYGIANQLGEETSRE